MQRLVGGLLRRRAALCTCNTYSAQLRFVHAESNNGARPGPPGPGRGGQQNRPFKFRPKQRGGSSKVGPTPQQKQLFRSTEILRGLNWQHQYAASVAKYKEIKTHLVNTGSAPDQMFLFFPMFAARQLRDWNTAKDILSFADQHRIYYDKLYELAFQILVDTKNIKEATALFDQLHKVNFKFTDRIIIPMIQMYSMDNKYTKVVEIFHRLPEYGIEPTLGIYTAILQALMNVDDSQTALALLDQLMQSEDPSLKPDCTTYTVMLAGLLHNLKEIGQRNDERILSNLSQVLSIIQASGIKPDIQLLRTMLGAYAELKDMSNVFKVADALQSQLSEDVDLFTLTALIRAFSQLHLRKYAKNTIDIALSSGKMLDSKFYSTYLEYCARFQYDETMFSVLEDMLQTGAAHDPRTFVRLLRELRTRQKDLDTATIDRVVDYLNKSGIRYNEYICSALVNINLAYKRVNEALEAKRRYEQDSGREVDFLILSHFLTYYASSRKWFEFWETLKEFEVSWKKMQRRPSLYWVRKILLEFIADAKYEDAKKFEELARHRLGATDKEIGPLPATQEKALEVLKTHHEAEASLKEQEREQEMSNLFA